MTPLPQIKDAKRASPGENGVVFILFFLESATRKLYFPKVGHRLESLIAKCSKLANAGS